MLAPQSQLSIELINWICSLFEMSLTQNKKLATLISNIISTITLEIDFKNINFQACNLHSSWDLYYYYV